jgi:hypothetical protein
MSILPRFAPRHSHVSVPQDFEADRQCTGQASVRTRDPWLLSTTCYIRTRGHGDTRDLDPRQVRAQEFHGQAGVPSSVRSRREQHWPSNNDDSWHARTAPHATRESRPHHAVTRATPLASPSVATAPPTTPRSYASGTAHATPTTTTTKVRALARLWHHRDYGAYHRSSH